MVLRNIRLPYICLNKIYWQSMRIVPSWRWQGACFMLKISTDCFGQKWWLMQFTHEIVVQQRRWILLHMRKCGAEGGHILDIRVCLGASFTQRCQMIKGASSMQRAQNVCFWVIVRGLRSIGSYVYKLKRSLKIKMWYLWKMTRALEHFGYSSKWDKWRSYGGGCGWIFPIIFLWWWWGVWGRNGRSLCCKWGGNRNSCGKWQPHWEIWQGWKIF